MCLFYVNILYKDLIISADFFGVFPHWLIAILVSLPSVISIYICMIGTLSRASPLIVELKDALATCVACTSDIQKKKKNTEKAGCNYSAKCYIERDTTTYVLCLSVCLSYTCIYL